MGGGGDVAGRGIIVVSWILMDLEITLKMLFTAIKVVGGEMWSRGEFNNLVLLVELI